MIKKNDLLDLKIDSLSPEARGLAKFDNKVVFVRDALPGEEVKARVVEVHENTIITEMSSIIKASPDRIEGSDAKWAHDGYARLANLKYDKQLKFKHDRVTDLLRNSDMSEIVVNDTVASPKQKGYLNEISLPVRDYNGRLEIGFYKPRTTQFVPINSFLITDKKVGEVLLGVRDVLRELKIPAYDENADTGFIKAIDVRRSATNEGMIVTLVAREKDRFDLPDITGMITERLHNIDGIVLNYNPKKTEQTFGDRNIALWGNDYITDQVKGLDFKISPRSYFQPNREQLDALIEKVLSSADFKTSDRVIDAYCGVGTLGLLASKKVKDVRGIEYWKVPITDARENIKNNNIENAAYYDGSVEQVMARWAKANENADVIIADPPKRGLTRGFVEAAAKMQPRRIIYISGNPETMIRDLLWLNQKGYKCNEITPFDVAPQTPDLKCVCVIDRLS